MAIAPSAPVPAPEPAQSWVHALRLATLLSMLLLAGLLVYVFIEREVIAFFLSLYVLALLLPLGAYGLLLWQEIFGNENRGLGFAIVWGTIMLAVGTTVLPATYLGPEITWIWLLYVLLFLLVQVALVASAFMTYYPRRREPGVSRACVQGLVFAGGYFVVTALAGAAVMPTMGYNPRGNEATAVRSFREINKCIASYAAQHPQQGFPGSLAELGAAGTKCLEADIAQGRKRYYEFAYTRGVPDATGRICTYTLQACPVHFEQGVRRFFTDESGLIRWTAEPRDATPADPVID